MTSAIHQALLDHNRQVPRYTSYPTAPHFSPEVTGEVFSGWVKALPDGASLSLYIHIPYCRQICWYCGCFTKATRKYAPVEGFVASLVEEIKHTSAELSGGQVVNHIHFGGGSPSMLKPDDFTSIMKVIREGYTVHPEAEIAIELDPREVTEAKVSAYAAGGVTRASLGVQDFHVEVQQAIGRRQPFHMVYDAVRFLRDYGISDINMDLLYGLPGQTLQRIEENVDFAVALNPSRIALFGYAHVPWMKKHMQLIDEAALPDGEARLKQFDAASARLAKRGYEAVGLDHFVRHTDPMAEALRTHTLRRNFQGYTTDAADALLGFGTSAISVLPQGYAQNTLVAKDYAETVSRGSYPVVKGKWVNEDDRLRRAVIETLMCYFEVDLDDFCKKRGLPCDYFDDALPELTSLAFEGLIRLLGRRIIIDQNARQAVRLAAAAFDSYLNPSVTRHAQVA
ncbi:oxygen-independent coproporphyrinogen III oxidase [Kordiimonas sp.]|uniref:oxygen-independent coproporphyrinogen III oxidase n=1 Tax=Kordiimonas sp. TaxID=1970157 RepID=UPI003A95920B